MRELTDIHRRKVAGNLRKTNLRKNKMNIKIKIKHKMHLKTIM